MRYILAIVLLLVCAGYVVSVERRISALESLSEHEVKTTWKSSGVVQEVRTTQNAGESLADWQDRHFAAVKAKQILFPPDAE